MAEVRNLLILFLVISCSIISSIADDKKTDKDGKEKPTKKKDIRDYNDADVERIYDQWEEDEEPLEDDELPEWKRPKPQIDLTKLNPKDPEGMLKMTKQGQTLMMFATVSGNPTEKETERISARWQGSLFNAHYDVQRYVVGDNRVLLMLKDGSHAWEIKDFLVKQERCEVVTIEGKDYPGKASPEYVDPDAKSKTKSKESSKKKSKENEAKKSTSKSSSKKRDDL
jgi:hypothetical protein